MARKPKRRQPTTRARRPAGAAGPTSSSSTTTPAAPRTTPARPAGEGRRVGGDQALVRSVEMSLAPGPASRRGGRIVLDSGDPAIPLDRVPYFLTDLIRLGIVAGVMVVLLFVAAELIIPRVVK